MPELPEVETVRRVLSPQLLGRIITGVIAVTPKVLAHPPLDTFCRAVESSVISGLGRRGKFLSLHMADGSEVIVHLRMTGQLVCVPADFPQRPHTHVIFRLDNDEELRFIDTRRFGRLWLRVTGESDTFSGVHRLGLEPFDEGFSADYLRQKLSGRRVTIKQALLDQTVVAGVGNIYADETLFASKLNPSLLTRDVTENGWQILAKVIPQILEKAIADNAVSAAEYLAGEGKRYRNYNFSVYGREGEGCLRCGTAIIRIKLAGRSSFFCPECQKPLAV